MKVGKLNFNILENLIKNNKGAIREEVKVRNTVGEDCAVLDFNGYKGVFSTDPITAAEKNSGRLAVHINCNDLASTGAEPVAILVTILAPPTSIIEDIEEVMKEISDEAKALNVEIVGGHTEITDSVNKMIISVTAIGKAMDNNVVKTSGAKLNDDIIVTKNLCLEGTYILTSEYHHRLINILSDEEFKEADKFIKEISVVKEGKIASEFGVNSMHDITEGGVLGALFEMAAASNVGFEVYEEKLPILNISKKVCKALNINPLGLISSGSMLITTDKGKELVDILEQNGVQSKIIGKIIKEDKILISGDKKQKVLEPKRDELFNIK